MMLKLRAATLILLWTILNFAAADEAAFERHDHLDVGLRSDHVSVVPGQTLKLGLHLVHDPNWHTYWINPGDSGLPTRLRWDLPDGWQAGEILWPWPSRYDIEHLVNHGYGGELLLPVEVKVADDAQPGSEVEIGLRASWLVCEVECIPGNAELSQRLRVSTDPQPASPELLRLFDLADSRRPELRPDWQAVYAVEGEQIRLRIEGDLSELGGAQVTAFPVQTQVAANGGQSRWQRDQGVLIWERKISDYFVSAPELLDLVLVTDGDSQGQAGYQISATLRPSLAGLASSASATAADRSELLGMGALQALLLAFAGGILLNLMPCVFPVLSFKALGFVESSGHAGRARRHGLLYTLGVLLSFAAIGALLLGLRAGGESLGWGFQLQNPLIVAMLAYLMVILGLSLSGLLNIGSSMMGIGASLSAGDGDRSAFFTGVLACVVASPCTAPLMGGALGFALTQPAAVAMSVFLALGLGMALPMLALSGFPALARLLPAPGAWMETFKQFLAFPLYLTAVWLVWVYGQLTDMNAMALLLVGIIGIALALWLWPQAGHVLSSRMTAVRRALSLTTALLALTLATPLGERWLLGAPAADQTQVDWEPWSVERLAELRADGRPVLVNMTAAWCITCLANERVALSSEAFARALDENSVIYLKGDWTRQGEDIAAYLESYGRSGVPLYVVYPSDGGEGRVLPQVLTPGLVREALRAAAEPAS